MTFFAKRMVAHQSQNVHGKQPGPVITDVKPPSWCSAPTSSNTQADPMTRAISQLATARKRTATSLWDNKTRPSAYADAGFHDRGPLSVARDSGFGTLTAG